MRACLLANIVGLLVATATVAESPDEPPPLPAKYRIAQAWWLEGESDPPMETLTPPTAIERADGTTLLPTWQPKPPPASFAGSECNFNAWCGDNVFSPDFSSCQVLFGTYGNRHAGSGIPEFTYLPVSLRAGWMLTAPDDRFGICSSNWECLADFTVAKMTSEYGSYLTGPSVLLRKNFFPFGSSLVPYAQVGAGLMITDAYRDESQQAYGDQCNVMFHAQVGLRCFVADRLSLDIEGGYQHLSNANFSGPNRGVNALGVLLGVTYHFRSGGQ